MKKLFLYKFHGHILLTLLLLISCREFLEIDPPQTALTTSTVFKNEETANAALLKIYLDMTQYSNTFASGETSFNNLGSLSADDLLNYNIYYDLEQFSQNSLSVYNISVNQNWTTIYNSIYSTNAIINGVMNSATLSLSAKDQLQGEAKFMRAFLYFYLVNFWGDVPLVLDTDYAINSTLPRTSAEKIYEQITIDLKDAQSLLKEDTSPEKIRPDKNAATALLARVYLYRQNWTEAESESTKVLTNSSFQLENDLNNVFLKESKETIWQLQSIIPYINTWDGYTFILTESPTKASLSNALVEAFETGDQRKTYWINSFSDSTQYWYYPFKYKVRTLPEATSTKTEYLIVFRLAEQLLIRAEARVQQGNSSGALEDLNTIRNRASLPSIMTSDQQTILAQIETERRSELFAEWGHRWLDLKRTSRLDAVLTPFKPGWQPTDALFPIPQSEINRNHQLTQNPGY